MAEPLIKLENLSFQYHGLDPVLDGVDLELMAGERLGLIGSNGSGKTTLLHLIVGLIKPSGGRIIAFGRERKLEADFVEVRAKAGLLFQDAEDQLFSPTVMEDVAFGPLNLGLDRQAARARALETLEALDLAKYADRITYRLSGGEKRMISLAAVLAMQPKVLLLDEPSSGLDERAVARIREVLLGLDQAMIIVSHRRDFLSGLADEVCMIDGGRLIIGDLTSPELVV